MSVRRFSKRFVGDARVRDTQPSEQLIRRLVPSLTAHEVDREDVSERLNARASVVVIVAQQLGYGFVAVLPFDDVCLTDMLSAS